MDEKFKASVKVMRSYDYCHFEVQLGTDEPQTLDEVNELRKKAAILVDEAVRQYKIAKAKEANRHAAEWQVAMAVSRKKEIEKKPENEWTIEEAAFMRGFAEREFWSEEENYCYGEDDERDHHFSMLRRFKEVKVRA